MSQPIKKRKLITLDVKYDIKQKYQNITRPIEIEK